MTFDLLQITINVLRNLVSVSTAPPVNKPGHPPDVTALIVTMETDVTTAWKGSREMIARNVPLVSRVMNANSVPGGSKETFVKNVFLVSREPNVNNVRRTITEIIVVIIFSTKIHVIESS